MNLSLQIDSRTVENGDTVWSCVVEGYGIKAKGFGTVMEDATKEGIRGYFTQYVMRSELNKGTSAGV